MRAWEFIGEHRLVWGRKKTSARGGVPILKWRCETGLRKGRIVPTVADCSKSPDVAAREKMKKTRARTKPTQSRRAKRTKKINTASRLIRRLNKSR
jgi:hypothetical protein